MLREVMDVLEFLDDERNGAEPFASLLPDGPQSVEITRSRATSARLISSKSYSRAYQANLMVATRLPPA